LDLLTHFCKLDRLLAMAKSFFYKKAQLTKKLFIVTPKANVVKLFFVQNLKIFTISLSLCPWQAFPA
jgi:hypothetical protein